MRKRSLLLLLALVCVCLLCGCASQDQEPTTEPTEAPSYPYDPSLDQDTWVYADIYYIERDPSSYSSCATARTLDGVDLQIYFRKDDVYEDFFLELTSDWPTDFILYDQPLRICGTLSKLGDNPCIVYDSSEILTGEAVPQAVSYDQRTVQDLLVYFEITDLSMEYSVWSSQAICCCTTPAGKTIWLTVDKANYEAEFGDFDTIFASKVHFDAPVQICGLARRTREMNVLSLRQEIGTDHIVQFLCVQDPA